MRIFETKKETIKDSIKNVGEVIYIENADGDLVPVLCNDFDGKLNEVKATHSIRLSRQNSSEQTYSPLSNSGLQLMVLKDTGLTLSGTDITQWDDLSGNGNHLTSDSATKPQNYNGAADLGGKAHFDLTTDLSLKEFTIIFAGTLDRLKSNIIVGNSADINESFGTAITLGDIYSFGLSSSLKYGVSGVTNILRGLHILTLTRDSNNVLKLRLNQTEVWSTTVDSATFDIDQIGRMGTVSPTMQGQIWEMSIYNKELPLEELKRVEGGVIKRNKIKI